MIKLLRIDDRLLHGQVAFSWTKMLSIDTIYVVNDQIAKDEITVMTLSIAKPRGTVLEVLSVSDGIAKIKTHVSDRKVVMIIVNNITDAGAIVSAVPEIKSINLGGIKEKPGVESHRFTGSVTLTMADLDVARQLRDQGIELEIRAVPEEKKNIINNSL